MTATLREAWMKHHLLASWLARGQLDAHRYIPGLESYTDESVAQLLGDPAFQNLIAFYRRHPGFNPAACPFEE